MIRCISFAALALFMTGCSSPPTDTSDGASSGSEREEAAPQRSSAPSAMPDSPPDPVYTTLANCTLLRSVPEEAGFHEYECAGAGGYRLIKTQVDLRDNITVIAPRGASYSLDLPALANGAFSSVGDTAEWSGVVGSQGPAALILRHQVMEDPDPAIAEVSYLLVVALHPEPCVIARIAPGPGQNAQARAAARRGGSCLGRT